MGVQYHIGLDEKRAGKYALLPGDPDRCEEIARLLQDAECVAKKREFTTYAGFLWGERVLVTSTGIGGPSAAIALEELCAMGVHTFIRVGTCGGMNPKVRSGDLVIASGAVRQEGTSKEYAPPEYPAVADYDVLSALSAAAYDNGVCAHIGVVQSKDSFYGQHSPGRMPVAEELMYKWQAWKRLGVLASEMETAALFVAGAALDVRVGACFSVLWNQETADKGKRGLLKSGTDNESQTESAVVLAVEAMKRMIEKDRM